MVVGNKIKEQKENAENILLLLKDDFPEYDDVVEYLKNSCKDIIELVDSREGLLKSFSNALTSAIDNEVLYCSKDQNEGSFKSDVTVEFANGYMKAMEQMKFFISKVLESYKGE